ncbi:testis-expressed protein 47 isoform X2 [Protopterus annectens]|uniref:testis-expressed protein 47 isoform X2 n=1 Tax=Protopterus annectens TaxID=7888 RepID=UPI001CFA8783|nr:testis-expressed protein 47 isoform X2 [Protopterus annectens]
MAELERTSEKSKKPKNMSAEIVGTSLFHHILNRRMILSAREEMKSLLHRLIFVGKISPELADKRDLAEYWEEMFQNVQRYYQGEGITGLLLIYPSYVIHILESSCDVLYSVIRDLKDMQKQGNRALILEPRILVVSHDIPTRLFYHWSYKVLNLTARWLGDISSNEPVERIVNDCLALLLKLGKHLQSSPKNSRVVPDSLIDKVPELIVPQDTIKHLLDRNELLTPEKFLQAYDSPLNIVMDSGHTFGSTCTETV